MRGMVFGWLPCAAYREDGLVERLLLAGMGHRMQSRMRATSPDALQLGGFGRAKPHYCCQDVGGWILR